LRGHGRSEGRENLKWTRISDYVADVSQIAARLPTMPVVIGHSLGGLIVQKYLEQYNAPAAILLAPSPIEGMFWSGLPLLFENPLLFLKVVFRQDYAVMFSKPKLAKKFLFSADANDEKNCRLCSSFRTRIVSR
jgi:pimeloyl-ACP methyl ester carboxylesterase